MKEEIKKLVEELNKASEAYYHSGNVIMDNFEFDRKMELLQKLEKENNLVMSNSPTINVGAPVLDTMHKVIHEYKPMLSLKKVYSANEVFDFAQLDYIVAMPKLDGLSIRLTYENGVLVKAETRGDGIEGSDATSHGRLICNIPLKINKDGIYVVDGEAIIKNDDFAKINEPLVKEEKFKNSRNLAAGSMTSFDTSVVKERKVKFILWDVIKGTPLNLFVEKLNEAKNLGFEVADAKILQGNIEAIQNAIDEITTESERKELPIDGVVFKFNDTVYGTSLGRTEKYFKDAVAYKPEDEYYQTSVVDVEWTMGKTGILTPTIVTEPVEIDGTEVNRASVHNVTIFKQFGFTKGCVCQIYKANKIIPQCYSVESITDESFEIPMICPYCGSQTEIVKDNDTEVLKCTNMDCTGKLLGLLGHFVSKNALNIDGMSEATLTFLMEKGWVSCYEDLFHLIDYKDKWAKEKGFGKKSVEKLLTAIEHSRIMTLTRFLYSLSIPLIGFTVSKQIAKYCNQDINEFCELVESKKLYQLLHIEGFGEKMLSSMENWFDKNWGMFLSLKEILIFSEQKKVEKTLKILEGKVFVITGDLIHFTNRDALRQKIESLEGKVAGSVSKNTFALICNDKSSNTGKSKKAKELGIQIINENEFLSMIGE